MQIVQQHLPDTAGRMTASSPSAVLPVSTTAAAARVRFVAACARKVLRIEAHDALATPMRMSDSPMSASSSSSYSKSSGSSGGVPTRQTMTLHVRTLYNQVHVVSVDIDGTVSDLKRVLHVQLGWHEHLIRFLFAGRPLDDKRKLASYKIQHESTVNVLFRLLGS